MKNKEFLTTMTLALEDITERFRKKIAKYEKIVFILCLFVTGLFCLSLAYRTVHKNLKPFIEFTEDTIREQGELIEMQQEIIRRFVPPEKVIKEPEPIIQI